MKIHRVEMHGSKIKKFALDNATPEEEKRLLELQKRIRIAAGWDKPIQEKQK
jgi:hypothetical protein